MRAVGNVFGSFTSSDTLSDPPKMTQQDFDHAKEMLDGALDFERETTWFPGSANCGVCKGYAFNKKFALPGLGACGCLVSLEMEVYGQRCAPSAQTPLKQIDLKQLPPANKLAHTGGLLYLEYPMTRGRSAMQKRVGSLDYLHRPKCPAKLMTGGRRTCTAKSTAVTAGVRSRMPVSSR